MHVLHVHTISTPVDGATPESRLPVGTGTGSGALDLLIQNDCEWMNANLS